MTIFAEPRAFVGRNLGQPAHLLDAARFDFWAAFSWAHLPEGVLGLYWCDGDFATGIGIPVARSRPDRALRSTGGILWEAGGTNP